MKLTDPGCAELDLGAFNVKEEIEFGSYELKVFRINDNMMQEIMITDEIENIGKDDQ